MPNGRRMGVFRVPISQQVDNPDALAMALATVKVIEHEYGIATQSHIYVIEGPQLEPHTSPFWDTMPEYDADIYPDNTVIWTLKHGHEAQAESE